MHIIIKSGLVAAHHKIVDNIDDGRTNKTYITHMYVCMYVCICIWTLSSMASFTTRKPSLYTLTQEIDEETAIAESCGRPVEVIKAIGSELSLRT